MLTWVLSLSKRCPKCGETKSVEQFYPDSHSPDGFHSKCGSCDRAAAQDYYRRNRGRVLARQKAAYHQSRRGVG